MCSSIVLFKSIQNVPVKSILFVNLLVVMIVVHGMHYLNALFDCVHRMNYSNTPRMHYVNLLFISYILTNNSNAY